MTDTTTLVDQAANREFTDFDKSTKEILSRKIAEKLDTNGYFDKLDHAKGFDLKESSNFEVEVEIDMAVEPQDLKKTIRSMEKKYNIQMKIINPNGPGGGWPVISITGAKNNVKKYLLTDYAHDPRDIKGLFPEVGI